MRKISSTVAALAVISAALLASCTPESPPLDPPETSGSSQSEADAGGSETMENEQATSASGTKSGNKKEDKPTTSATRSVDENEDTTTTAAVTTDKDGEY